MYFIVDKSPDGSLFVADTKDGVVEKLSFYQYRDLVSQGVQILTKEAFSYTAFAKDGRWALKLDKSFYSFLKRRKESYDIGEYLDSHFNLTIWRAAQGHPGLDYTPVKVFDYIETRNFMALLFKFSDSGSYLLYVMKDRGTASTIILNDWRFEKYPTSSGRNVMRMLNAKGIAYSSQVEDDIWLLGYSLDLRVIKLLSLYDFNNIITINNEKEVVLQ